MPVIVFFCVSVQHVTTFTLMIFHFRLRGKVFSVDLPLPIWWETILICFVGLMDPENIGLAVEIEFLSCLQAEI